MTFHTLQQISEVRSSLETCLEPCDVPLAGSRVIHRHQMINFVRRGGQRNCARASSPRRTQRHDTASSRILRNSKMNNLAISGVCWVRQGEVGGRRKIEYVPSSRIDRSVTTRNGDCFWRNNLSSRQRYSTREC